MPFGSAALPSPRNHREVAMVLGFIVLLVILFGLLWLLGPLPRSFPLMCSNGLQTPPIGIR